METALHTLWIILPVIPLTAVSLAMICSYLFHREWTFPIARIGTAVLVCASAAVSYLGIQVGTYQEIALMPSGFAIVFLFEPMKLYLLWSLMVPTLLSLFRIRSLSSPRMVMVFLFYLSGCTGIVVTGDVFNFFVFYELMIMGAYVLISVKGDHGASVKYMIFGAVSSAIFLAGIVMLYSSGAYFTYGFTSELSGSGEVNVILALYLFLCAFFIKGAFFPVSGWVATCHSAANALVSAFLASFTIFSSVLGIYYMVLLPAEALGFSEIFVLLRIISGITIAAGALFLFFEDQFKRVVAASTVFSIGVVGLLLSYRLYEPAFLYVLIHAAYKSLLFYAYDDMSQEGLRLTIPLATLLIFLPVLYYAAGFSPAVTGLLKYEIPPEAYSSLKPLFFASSGLLAAGFAKFPLTLQVKKPVSLPVLLSLASGVILTGYIGSHRVIPGEFLTEIAIFSASLLLGRLVYRRSPALHRLDRRVFYRTLNQELLLVLILMIFSWMILFLFPGHGAPVGRFI